MILKIFFHILKDKCAMSAQIVDSRLVHDLIKYDLNYFFFIYTKSPKKYLGLFFNIEKYQMVR